MEPKRIVVLGGGYAGVEAAKKLHKRYKKNKEVEILLIDRNPYHTLMTELHEVAGSRTEPEAVQISFKRIFSGTKVTVVVDEIDTVDFEKQVLKSDVATYPYDYLVLSTGGRPEFFGINGVQQNSFTLWSLEDSIRIREHVELMFREAAKEPHPELKKKLLTFVVAGAGFTGIELVGELIERADVLCRKYHIDRGEVKLMVVEALDHVLPILAKAPQKKAHRYLEKKGVEILLNAAIVKGEEGAYTLTDGRKIEAKTFVWTCGVQASEFTAKINLTKGKVSNDKCSVATPEGIHGMAACYFEEDEKEIVGERGRILVNDKMQSVDRANVFLAGDMIWYLHNGKVVPQIVENALQSAHTAAHNIIADMEKKPLAAYKPSFHGFMVSIGSRFGVASVMGLNLVGFFAMALKHLINLHYLWGLAGFNAVWGYLREEFVDVKNKRSLLHGHASAKIPAWIALPARLWLGLVWLAEGLNKVGEGWLNFDKSRTGWMFSPGVRQAGTPAVADATVSATPWPAETVAPETVTAATPQPLTDAADQAVQTFGKVWDLNQPIFATDSWVVTLFRTVFMDNGAAHLPFALFQLSIVAVEVLIGLALLAGLFTLPTAILSIGMCVVFILSGMFSWSQLWFIFLAVVMLGGAGKSFGLDHYVVPWLKHRWSSMKLAQKTYLYAGEPFVKNKKNVKNKRK